MLDIDYFKSYNDTYGHLEGDTVLKRVADALAQCDILPHNALLARIGGEEFALVVEQVTPAQLTAIATQLCYLVEQLNIPHQVSPLAVVTISIGSVFLPLDKVSGLKMADVLRRADVCLYRAKDKGRNRVEVEVI
jgi:diguanylate cyclase (GGDEF)-like protein